MILIVANVYADAQQVRCRRFRRGRRVVPSFKYTLQITNLKLLKMNVSTTGRDGVILLG